MRKLFAAAVMTAALVFGGADRAAAQEHQDLVNVHVGDVVVLEHVTADVAAQVLGLVCANVQAEEVAALAAEVAETGQASDVVCEGELEGESGPITIAPHSEQQASVVTREPGR